MIGVVAGDIIGSVYEHWDPGTRDFPLFIPRSVYTDDSVLALAVAEAILRGREYGEVIREFGLRYPDAGYGGSFFRWLREKDPKPYNSWGNGSAMRVPAVGFAFDSEERVLREAELTALPTHNHPEGTKGAQAVALAVFLARKNAGKEEIRKRLSDRFGYDLTRSVEEIQPDYSFDVSCQGSVPEAIIAFLDSSSFEEALRNAVFLGGDSDTLACMAGAVAEAFYGGVPRPIVTETLERLPEHLKDVLERFEARYGTTGTGGSKVEVKGRFKIDTDKIDRDPKGGKSAKSAGSEKAAAEEEALNREILGSNYFKKNVGYMKSENTDTEKLTRAEIEEIDEADDADELEDLYSLNATREREERRREMRERGTWYHDNGTEVTTGRHLAVAERKRSLEFIEKLEAGYGIEGCLPDYLLFLDILNPYESLLFFLSTAEEVHVDLTGISPEDIKNGTVEAGGPVPLKEELSAGTMAAWLINRIFWSDAVGKAWWYTGDRRGYHRLLKSRVSRKRFRRLE
jgi:ADP-ribosylglycohydrolase